MFGLLNKVFGVNPSKIGSELTKSLLGDYAESKNLIGDFFQDMGTDIKSTATSWGKTLGLLEDPKSDYDLAVENAKDRMQPILEKYQEGIDGSRPPDVYGNWQPDEVEAKVEMEMTEMNAGEEAVVDSLAEILHELPSAEGKIGTEFYSLNTESGLQNMLENLKDASGKIQ
jgi:hypothetical protein